MVILPTAGRDVHLPRASRLPALVRAQDLTVDVAPGVEWGCEPDWTSEDERGSTRRPPSRQIRRVT